MNRKPLLIFASAILLAVFGLISCNKSKDGPSLSDGEILLIALATAPSYPGCTGTTSSYTQIQPGGDYKYSIGDGQYCFFNVSTMSGCYNYTLSSEWGNQPLYVAAFSSTAPGSSHVTDSVSWSYSSTDPGQSSRSLYVCPSMNPSYVEVDGFVGVFTLNVHQ